MRQRTLYGKQPATPTFMMLNISIVPAEGTLHPPSDNGFSGLENLQLDVAPMSHPLLPDDEITNRSDFSIMSSDQDRSLRPKCPDHNLPNNLIIISSHGDRHKNLRAQEPD